MNKFLYIGIGIAVGGVSGYLLAELIAYKISEEQWLEEEDFDTDPQFTNLDFVSETGEVLKRKMERGEMVDYNKFSKQSLETLVEPYVESVEPQIISLEEWVNFSEEDYERCVVTYYEADTTFANQNEEIIKAPQELFGVPNIHLHFGEKSEDSDIVYVVNPNVESVFEVVRIHESYKVQVLGEEPSKKKRGPGRPRKEKPVKPADDAETEQ